MFLIGHVALEWIGMGCFRLLVMALAHRNPKHLFSVLALFELLLVTQ
jgi:hypothetical protein